MLGFLNVCESFPLVLTKITRHRKRSTEKNEGMPLRILVILVLFSYVSVSTKEQCGDSSAEFESAIILNICLESEVRLLIKLHFRYSVSSYRK